MKPETEQITVGDTVRWTSDGNGKRKERRGIVVHIIEPGQTPNARLIAQAQSASESFEVGFARSQVSYIVRVERVNKKSKNKVFWPKVSTLVKVHPPVLSTEPKP